MLATGLKINSLNNDFNRFSIIGDILVADRFSYIIILIYTNGFIISEIIDFKHNE